MRFLRVAYHNIFHETFRRVFYTNGVLDGETVFVVSMWAAIGITATAYFWLFSRGAMI